MNRLNTLFSVFLICGPTFNQSRECSEICELMQCRARSVPSNLPSSPGSEAGSEREGDDSRKLIKRANTSNNVKVVVFCLPNTQHCPSDCSAAIGRAERAHACLEEVNCPSACLSFIKTFSSCLCSRTRPASASPQIMDASLSLSLEPPLQVLSSFGVSTVHRGNCYLRHGDPSWMGIIVSQQVTPQNLNPSLSVELSKQSHRCRCHSSCLLFLNDSRSSRTLLQNPHLGVDIGKLIDAKPMPKGRETLRCATSVGTMVGQVSFGVLADLYKRRKLYGMELLVMLIAIVGV